MKRKPFTLKIALLSAAWMMLFIFITGKAFSQENNGKPNQKRIVVKIVTEDNGKTTMVDTTMEMPDSSQMDSVRKQIDKIIMFDGGGKHHHGKIHGMPQGFSYDFGMPPPPECPMGLDEPEGMEMDVMEDDNDSEGNGWEQTAPRAECRMMRSGGHRQTLTDILGDIPMDRVVSYSIKDRKNGKRIIIDLNNASIFEREDRVIVIHGSGKMQQSKHHPQHQVKVYMKRDDDEKIDKNPEQPAPSSVPPPSANPDKSSPKKPKI